MKKDKWITPDNYHFRDIFDNGRCLWCGKLANSTLLLKSGKDVLACSRDCRTKISKLSVEIPTGILKG